MIERHQLEWGIGIFSERLHEAEKHLIKCQQIYDSAADNLAYVKEEVNWLKSLIPALERLAR